MLSTARLCCLLFAFSVCMVAVVSLSQVLPERPIELGLDHGDINADSSEIIQQQAAAMDAFQEALSEHQSVMVERIESDLGTQAETSLAANQGDDLEDVDMHQSKSSKMSVGIAHIENATAMLQTLECCKNQTMILTTIVSDLKNIRLQEDHRVLIKHIKDSLRELGEWLSTPRGDIEHKITRLDDHSSVWDHGSCQRVTQ